MKTGLGKCRTRLSIAGYVLLALCAGQRDSYAGKLNPANWIIYNFSGPLATNLTTSSPVPPTGLHVVSTGGANSVVQTNGQSAALAAVNQLTGLTDNNLATFTTLSSPAVLLIDMGQTNLLDRVYAVGSTKPSNIWVNAGVDGSVPPLGLIVVYVGNTPTTATQVATYTVPYDAGNPVETEMDLRFNPAAGRYVRLELHTAVTWGVNYWPGSAITQPSETNKNWNVGELELYGFSGAAATETNVNAVVLPTGAAAPLAQAASDLSYYLGELTGLPHPIVASATTNQYSGMIYQIENLSALAPSYSVMMANITSGALPTNISATISGKVVTFKGWPYRTVLWSVWDFLEDQGIRWVYPDAHGDYVPATGLNLSVLPFTNTPPTLSILANFDCGQLEPWLYKDLQTVRQEYLYPWRNHWTSWWNGYGPLGGSEIPDEPQPGVINSLYTEGFSGVTVYPHTFESVVPTRILAMPAYTNWWGWATTSSSSAVNDSGENDPVFEMDNPSLISWVASKVTNWAQADPLPCSWPLNINHSKRPWQLLPQDACTYSQDPYTVASNGPVVPDPVPWVKIYTNSYSGAYYSFINAVAKQVQQMGSGALVGALAYSDVFLPPTNIAALATFPTNVQTEVCLYGAPNLPMSSPANAAMEAAFNGWHSCCSHLCTYDYALLHTDSSEPDPQLPVPLVAATVNRAQYVASIGALDGGCQANLTSLPYNPWNFYAYPRIRWNTNQTAAQLEQEFFTGYYREAAAPMLAYYQAMENYQVSNNVSMYYGGYCYNVMPGTFPLSLLAVMRTDLAGAQSLATNWWVSNRVATAAAGFNWILTNCPDFFASGVNFTNTSLYPVLSPTTNLTALSLAGWFDLTGGVWSPWYAGYASPQGSGANTTWKFNAQGWIQQTYNIPAGTYHVNVMASGVEAVGNWPVMNVYFGPDYGGSVTVNTTTSTTYSFTFTIPASGAWDMVITYNKNSVANGTLTVNGIQISQL